MNTNYDFSKWEEQRKEAQRIAKERALRNLNRFLEAARKAGFTSVYVYFDGQGDSGSIEEINFEALNNEGIGGLEDQVTIQMEDMHTYWTGSEHKREEITVESTLAKAIEDIVYDLIDETGIDWYNNDGGFGNFTLDIVKGTYKLDVSYRFTESSMEYDAEVDIATGAELEV